MIAMRLHCLMICRLITRIVRLSRAWPQMPYSRKDLGDQLAVRSVGALSATAIDYALDAGEDEAKAIMAVKPIAGALIRVKDHIRVVGLDIT